MTRRAQIRAAFQEAKGVTAAAARILGVTQQTLQRWLGKDPELRSELKIVTAKRYVKTGDATPLADRSVSNRELRAAGFWKEGREKP